MKPTKEFIDKIKKALSPESSDVDFSEALHEIDESNLPNTYVQRLLAYYKKHYSVTAKTMLELSEDYKDNDQDSYDFVTAAYHYAMYRQTGITMLAKKYAKEHD